MKKFGGFALCLLLSVILFTSCLNDSETVVYPYVSLTAFSIGDITTKTYYTDSQGEDSVVSVTLGGSNYHFTIDQQKGLIYNNDSLPLGTDITHVLVSLTADGSVYYKTDSGSVAYAASDSINFTKPVVFTIYSTDGLYSRNYTVSVNVRTQKPDSLLWQGMLGSNFQGDKFSHHKAVAFNNRIYVFGSKTSGGQVCVTSTAQTDGVTWTALQPLQGGIASTADYSSVTLFLNKLYILADGKLYNSADGLTWSSVATNMTLSTLIAASYTGSVMPAMWAVSGSHIVGAADGENFSTYESLPTGFPTSSLSGLCYPLHANPNIDRYFVVGLSNDLANQGSVWSRLSTESDWSQYTGDESNPYYCPRLNNLTVIRYNAQLWAFGGAGYSIQDSANVAAFEAFYISTDNGVTWKKSTEGIMFPSNFKGRSDAFSCAVDDHGYIWFMRSASQGEVFKAHLIELDE